MVVVPWKVVNTKASVPEIFRSVDGVIPLENRKCHLRVRQDVHRLNQCEKLKLKN